jgi:hypothetical protein
MDAKNYQSRLVYKAEQASGQATRAKQNRQVGKLQEQWKGPKETSGLAPSVTEGIIIFLEKVRYRL